MLSIRSAFCVFFACINVHALASQVQISSKAIGDIGAGTRISLDVNLQATEAISATYLAIEFDPDLLVFVGADNLASNGSQFIVNANDKLLGRVFIAMASINQPFSKGNHVLFVLNFEAGDWAQTKTTDVRFSNSVGSEVAAGVTGSPVELSLIEGTILFNETPGGYPIEIDATESQAPEITLIGEASITHEAGTPFTDPGAIAIDSFEGDLTSSILVAGTVDANTPGTYGISYNVSDGSGNQATGLTREVIVVDTLAPEITLIGEVTIIHEAGHPFTDPGASALDNIDGDLTASIQVSGQVDSNVPGDYALTYNVSDQSGNAAAAQTRAVKVVDTTAPVITLNGDTNVVHLVGPAYVDAGATSSDLVDGDVPVQTAGSVDVLQLGDYTLTYTAVDQAGNQAEPKTRTVMVTDGLSVGDLVLTSSDVFEGGGPVTAILFMKQPSLGEVVPIYAETDLPGRILVDGPSAILAGTEKIEFTITAVDDTDVNGNAPFSLRIHNGYRELNGTNMTVTDNDVPETISGTVADGLISNATVFFDANGNRSPDAGEPSTTTDKSGRFNLQLPASQFDKNGDGRVDSKDGFIVSLGGIDTATGVSIDYPLLAPPTASVVNPVTSIVVSVMESNQNLDESTASGLVKTSLGIKDNVDVLNFDMFSEASKGNADSVDVIKSAAKLQDTIVQATSIIKGSTEGAGLDTSSITKSLAQKVLNGETVNLDDSNQVGELIDSAAKTENKTISADNVKKAASVIAQGNEMKEAATSAATSIEEAALEMSRIQSFAQSETRSDLEALADNKTTVEELDIKYERQNVVGLVSTSTAGPLFGVDARSGTFQFNTTNFKVKENGEVVSDLKINRADGNLGEVTLRLTPKAGTASAGSDFADSSFTVTFGDQELFKTVNLSQWVLDDLDTEASETFELALEIDTTNGTGAKLGEQILATGSILDDDTVGVFQFARTQVSVNENSEETTGVVIERTDGSRGEVKLTIQAIERPQGAVQGQDFDLTMTEVIFADGVLKRRLTFNVIDDQLLESSETFQMNITSVESEFPGASVGANKSTTVQIVSDEINNVPVISSIDDQILEEGENLSGVTFTVSDDYTAASQLTVSAASSDDILLRDSAITLTPGAQTGEWILSATPTVDRTGDTTITVTVRDGVLTNSTSFNLYVINVNDPPQMSELPATIMAVGQAVTVPLTIIDIDNGRGEVFISPQADNEDYLLQDKMRFVGSGNNWEIIFNENGTATGSALYTLTVTDSGGAQSSQTFRVYFSDPGTIVTPPTINFSVGANNTLILSWEEGYELYESTDLRQGFSPVAGAQTPYVVDMVNIRFYMLKGVGVKL